VTQRNYVQGQYVGTTPYFYTRDHLGSIREMFSGGGTVVARYDCDPFGRSTTVLGTTPTDFNFTGLYRHSKSNLDLATYRAYDPDLGRWLSRDPIAERGGLNLYGYVGNNALNASDPLGLFNPTKGAAAVINVVNAGRLAGLGLVRWGIGELLTDTGAGAPPGLVTLAVGTWNLSGAHRAWNRAEKQWDEAWAQDWSEMSARNLLGFLPYGTEYDDPCEPSMSDVFKQKLKEWKEKPWEIIREIGTLGS
jgi:type VI secretion system secreted protein VgrG